MLAALVHPAVLLAVAVAIAVVVAVGAPTQVAAQDDPEPPSTVSVTVNEFYPDDANLSDCVGLVERPGCGSEARGGWRQAAILAAVVVGLGIIGWRISVGIRRGRAAASDSAEQPARPPGRNPA